MNTKERLSKIEKKISSPEFRNDLGGANEVNYFVFDYEPKDELIVREYVEGLVNKINSQTFLDYHISCFDLYEILINYLKEEDLFEAIFEMEEEEGWEEVVNSIIDSMGIDTLEDNYFINHIAENIDENSIVFITGVGKVFPVVRAHKILNNMHQMIEKVPVVLFLPGTYSGLEIKLFGTLGNNYYRSFRLID
ncbi:MAG: DUF1788 domain-containing protein [Firmicutes bacterium]|nr:DUF1788 domain-containing protein [Bacillota bacterium]